MQNKSQLMGHREHTAFIFAHIAFFVIFVWFGMLKIADLSPATPLVEHLFNVTLAPFISFNLFIVLFGMFEVLIGVLFIIPKMDKIALALLIPHMLSTMAPLVLLPHETWHGFLIPSIEGQYIIKNLIVIALAASIFVDMKKRVVK